MRPNAWAATRATIVAAWSSRTDRAVIWMRLHSFRLRMRLHCCNTNVSCDLFASFFLKSVFKWTARLACLLLFTFIVACGISIVARRRCVVNAARECSVVAWFLFLLLAVSCYKECCQVFLHVSLRLQLLLLTTFLCCCTVCQHFYYVVLADFLPQIWSFNFNKCISD